MFKTIKISNSFCFNKAMNTMFFIGLVQGSFMPEMDEVPGPQVKKKTKTGKGELHFIWFSVVIFKKTTNFIGTGHY